MKKNLEKWMKKSWKQHVSQLTALRSTLARLSAEAAQATPSLSAFRRGLAVLSQRTSQEEAATRTPIFGRFRASNGAKRGVFGPFLVLS